MKTFCLVIIVLFLSSGVYGQIKTDEKKISVNKTVGDTTYTESTSFSQTEDITVRNSMIVINPLKFFLFYNISYFANVSDRLVLGAGIQTPTIRGINGFGINAEARYYPRGKNMRGFYIAPNIAYNNIKADDGSINPFSMGVLLGWQWFPGDQFAMGLGIGLDYYTGSVNNKNNSFESYHGSVPAIRFDIGYAW